MGIPVDLDVTKYMAAQEEGKSAPEAREAGRLHENARFTLPKEKEQKQVKQQKERKQAAKQARKEKQAKHADKAAESQQPTVKADTKTAAAPVKVKGEQPESAQAVAAEMAQ